MATSQSFDVSNDTIFVSGLPEDTTEDQLAEHFGQIGIIKLDKKNNCKKIWIYKDKTTGKGKGEATITYDDPPTATSAIAWFNGKEFRDSKLSVELAQRKSTPYSTRGGGGSAGVGQRGGGRGGGPGGFGGGRRNDGDSYEAKSRPSGSGRPGDWMCPSCSNNNFAYRQECNRCQAQKPASVGGTNERGGGGGSGGRGSHYNSGRHHSDNSRGGNSRDGGHGFRENDYRDRHGGGHRGERGSYRDHDRDRYRGSGNSHHGGGGPTRGHNRDRDDRRQRPY